MNEDAQQTIAVVEDDEAIASLLAYVVEEFTNYRPLIICDGSEAMRMIDEAHPALILLDVALPGVDGFHIYDSLKANTNTQDIPVIFVTVHESSYFRMRQRGARWFLSKPFELGDLLSTMQAALASTRTKAA